MARLRCLVSSARALAVLLAPQAAPAREPGGSLLVAVAANLKPAFEEIAGAFEAANPGVRIRATYGGSGTFLAQILNGAPFDVFLSADAEYPARVAAAGLADGVPFTYAYGSLAVWVPAGSTLDLERDRLAALANPCVRRIAIANPEVAPYGRAALAALRAAGVHDRVKERLVMGQNASQAAQFVQSGNAQAGLVPLALALAPPLSQEGRHLVVSEETYDRIEQAGVVLTRAREPRRAHAFVAFLSGPGRAVLEKHGYGVPRLVAAGR